MKFALFVVFGLIAVSVESRTIKSDQIVSYARGRSFTEVRDIVEAAAGGVKTELDSALEEQRVLLEQAFTDFQNKEDAIIAPTIEAIKNGVAALVPMPGSVCPKHANAIEPTLVNKASECQKGGKDYTEEIKRGNAIFYTILGKIYSIVAKCLDEPFEQQVSCAQTEVATLKSELDGKADDIKAKFNLYIPVFVKDVETCFNIASTYASTDLSRVTATCNEIRDKPEE